MRYGITLDCIDRLMENLDNPEMGSLIMMFNHSFLGNKPMRMAIFYLQETAIINSFTLFIQFSI